MPNRDILVCSDYIEAVFRRASEPMEPKNFSPNWDDQPSRYKNYLHVERFPLETKLPPRLASMSEVMTKVSSPKSTVGELTFDKISILLLLTYGILNRRLDVNWNHDHSGRSRYHQAIFGRGTASGGGMYPAEIYWICGQSGPLLPGLYHYDNAHLAFSRLLTGDLTQSVRAALFEHPAAIATDQFLLVSLNFWKNSFKYSSFCYHVVTQDVGALLGSFRLMAASLDTDLEFLFWYQDEQINRLLGLETYSESVFAVVPISTAQPIPSTSEWSHPISNVMNGYINAQQKLNAPLVTRHSYQRSRSVIRFPIVERVHQSTLIGGNEPRPNTRGAFKASCEVFAPAGEQIELPPPEIELLHEDILTVFKKRRSGFGRFSNHVPLSAVELSTTLYFGSTLCNYTADIKEKEDSPHFTRLAVIINNVGCINRGAYSYDWVHRCLWTIYQGDLSLFMQNHYFLQNYNFVEIGALIVIIGRPERMLEVYGNRGYRILNAEVGLVAQNIYMISTALSLNCGAVLGLDNLALNSVFHLEDTDERSMLFLLIGHGGEGNADFDAQYF